MLGVIYLLINKFNGKVYVGQTRNPKGRFACHRNWHKIHRHQTRISGAIKKWGWESFDQQIVAECSEQNQLSKLEKLWILLLRTTDQNYGYNLTSGGEHWTLSEDGVKQLSTALRGRVPWNKGKRGVQVAWNKGKPNPQQSRRMSELLKGKPAWNKGIKNPALSERNKVNPPSQTTKDKISAALKAKGCRPPVTSLPGKLNPSYGKRYGKALFWWKRTQSLEVRS